MEPAAIELSVTDAIARTRDLARSLFDPSGIATRPAEDVTVVADRSNLVLHVASPHPVIARVAMATSAVRVGMAWLRREIEVARHLTAEGAAVTQPCAVIDPGPHERDGFLISFWEVEPVVPDAAPDPVEAGVRLGEIHASLAGYPTEKLPLWGGYEEARQILDRVRASKLVTEAEMDRLLRAFDEADAIVQGARARSASFQAVHGDAHIGNVLATTRGAVWTDFEDAFVGPVEIDLACLRSRADLFGEDRTIIDAMMKAYGAPFNPELVQDLSLVRNVQVIPWLAVFSERQPELLPRMRARIAKLPA